MAAGPKDGPKYGWRIALRAEIRFLASYNRNFSTRSKPSWSSLGARLTKGSGG